MIICVDVGNTNTVINNIRCKTDPEAIISALETLKEQCSRSADTSQDLMPTGAILSSVVPSVNDVICKTIHNLFGLETIIVNPKMNMNIYIPEKYHEELGADIITGCVAAVEKYGAPVAVIDMGTCSTIFAIDKNKELIGGTIHPGIKMELRDLGNNTALLPKINFEAPEKVIGKNTSECILSGVLYGHAGMVDAIVGHMEEELGEKLTVVLTGGLSKFVAPLCQHELYLEPDLLTDGLELLYKYNT